MTNGLLSADAIFDSVAKEMQLERYADIGIKHRFRRIIDGFNGNGAIAGKDRPAALMQIEAMVRNRLELARDWAIYPEIGDEKIEQPIFVVGHGRTGTTVMQYLLSLGDGCRAPVSWESRYPSPPPGLDPQSDAERIARENKHIHELGQRIPNLLVAHPYLDEGALMEVEDEDLFALDFLHPFAWHYDKVPVLPFGHHTKVDDIRTAFQFHKQLLKHYQWKRPTKRWICKGVLHCHSLPVLWEVYPDALCIWTHRDPVMFIGSFLELAGSCFKVFTGMDMKACAHDIVDNIRTGYEEIINEPWLNDERLVHVRFADFVKDQVGMIRKIYESRGWEFSQAHETCMRSWLADPAHKSDRYGKFHYSVEKFGFSSTEIKTAFAVYEERFLM